MVFSRQTAFFVLIAVFGLAVSSIAYFTVGLITPLTLTIRLLALNGYILLAVAAIMTPFFKEITLFFRKPFLKMHHYFAAAGLLLITLHPIAVAIQAMSPTVFEPNFTSPFLFFYFGGVIALILIYLGFGAALLRRHIMAYWRYFHVLIYLALFVGVVHANVRGIDFSNPVIQSIYDALFAVVLVAFGLKRLQTYRLNKRIRKARLMAQAKQSKQKTKLTLRNLFSALCFKKYKVYSTK